MKSPPVEQLSLLKETKHKPPATKSHFKRYNEDLMCPGVAICQDKEHCRHSTAHRWETDCDYGCGYKGSRNNVPPCRSLTKVVLEKLKGD